MLIYYNTKKKENCYGCRACEQRCPKRCIHMKHDEEGFLYPEIEEKNCIKCGTCSKTCPIKRENIKKEFREIPKTYVAINKNEDSRRTSSSGGMFTLLSDFVLEQNGVVFGASFNEKFQVIHDVATNKEECEKFKGSKYVQSDIRDTYTLVNDYLNKGSKVLFSGTPCQIAGLYGFLGREEENLYTVDLICHGVPSPKVFGDYLRYLHQGKEITSIHFRDKSLGWKEAHLKIKYKNDKDYLKNRINDPYFLLFLNEAISRPACHECRFTKINRESDITIGDFWGVENKKPNLYDNKGISILLVNTKNGEQLFNFIKEKAIYETCTIEEALQPNLKAPTPKGENRDRFFSIYVKKGFAKAVEEINR